MSTSDPAELARWLEFSPFAVLGTQGRDGGLDLVPCCFALDDRYGTVELVTAVDHKPKRSVRLAIDALADKYEQYRQRRPAGPAIRLSPERWSGWTA